MKAAFKTVIGALFVLAMGWSGVDAKEYRIGVHLPLTGPLALSGNGVFEGITAAVDVFNRNHPNFTIKQLTIDDEGTTEKVAAAVEKLASQGVVGIAGGYATNLVGVGSETANKLGLPYVTSGGTADSLISRGHKRFFKLADTHAYANAVVGLIAEMGAKKVSVLYSTKEGTAEMAQHVIKALTAKGIQTVSHPYEVSTTDFKPLINKVKIQDRPDVIYMGSYENDYVGMLRAAKVLKPKVKAMIGVTGIATAKMAAAFPDILNNVYGTTMLSVPAEFTTADGKAFNEAYRRLYKKDPNDFLAQIGFITGRIMCEAVKRAADKGTLATGGLAEEIRKTDYRDSMIGPVAFDKVGRNYKFGIRYGQYQNGKIALVWPREYANGKMNYPGVPW